MDRIVRYHCMCLFVLLLSQLTSSTTAGTYRAAVVEYYPVKNWTLTAEERANANVDKYIELIRDLNDQDIDIIVYPEATLIMGLLDTRKNLADIGVFVPEATDNIKPCDNDNFLKYFQKLSCFAIEISSYIVVNLVEKEICDKNTIPASGKCADDYINFYNCDVVFDRNGRVIQRYRKYNLFGEFNMAVTKEVDVATFDTDFNVTFGLFTCFDILFEKPPLLLVRQGVKHIIFPTMWFSELPFLTALQAQSMFAVGNDVVVLAAGANSASRGSGGTGIYQGYLGPVEYDILPYDGSKVYIDNVYKNWDMMTNLETQVITPTELIDAQGLAMDNCVLKKDDLSPYQYYLMTDKIIDKEFIINDKTTCHLSWKATYQTTTAQHYQYAFFYYSGVRSFAHVSNGGIDVCGVVFCQAYDANNFDYTKCGKRYSSYSDIEWPFVIQQLSIVANFTNKTSSIQYPNTLMSNIRSLDRDDYEWSSEYYEKDTIVERTLTLLKPQTRLISFGIYGRDFGRDSSAFWISGNVTVITALLLSALLNVNVL